MPIPSCPARILNSTLHCPLSNAYCKSCHIQPAFIQKNFHISKGEFKRALGHLYKRRLVDKVNDGFKLIEQEDRRDA